MKIVLVMELSDKNNALLIDLVRKFVLSNTLLIEEADVHMAAKPGEPWPEDMLRVGKLLEHIL